MALPSATVRPFFWPAAGLRYPAVACDLCFPFPVLLACFPTPSSVFPFIYLPRRPLGGGLYVQALHEKRTGFLIQAFVILHYFGVHGQCPCEMKKYSLQTDKVKDVCRDDGNKADDQILWQALQRLLPSFLILRWYLVWLDKSWQELQLISPLCNRIPCASTYAGELND